MDEVASVSCRPDQLFGLWAIEETRMREYVALAKSADLEQLRAESRAAAARAADEPLYQATSDGIAIIDLSGPLTKYPHSFQALTGGTSMVLARKALRAAARDPEVGGIILRVDSPGGTVAGGAELAADIRRCAAVKPLHAYADDLACSGGLLALVQGTKVWAGPSTEIGSIGVYMAVKDTSEVYAQKGVKVHVISSAPPIKGAAVEGTEITEPQLEEWRRRVTDLADWFIGEVATGRRLSWEDVKPLATGEVWVAEKARERGLIDGVLTFDEALERLRGDVMSENEARAAELRVEEAQQAAAAATAALEKAEAETEKARSEAEAVKKELAQAKAQKRQEAFSKKAEELGLPAEATALLDQIEAAVGEKGFAQLETYFKGLGARVDETVLFGEKGSEGRASSDEPGAMLKGLADNLIAEGKAKDFYEAYELACKMRPDLVNQARPGKVA